MPSDVTLDVRPLTPDLWPALEDLFGRSGACNGCWCVYWRIGTAYHQRDRAKNKAALRRIVKRGPPPGLLAFDGDVAVGWCQLTPRADLPWLDRTRHLTRVDDRPVWSLSRRRPRSRPIRSTPASPGAPTTCSRARPRRSPAPDSRRSPAARRTGR